MIEQILAHFPPDTHDLTLVSDPDNVLADETVLTRLAERGFTLIQETDPVQLRSRVSKFGSFDVTSPLIVVSSGRLENLPYDLWQQGYHVTLALHTFFPRLAYPIVQALTPDQRWRLSQAPAPARSLGQQASVDFILTHVFEVDAGKVQQPAQLITWLNGHHQSDDRGDMPEIFVQRLLAQLGDNPAYQKWPLADLLRNRQTFVQFVTDEWQIYLQSESGKMLGEVAPSVQYHLSFAVDSALQDALPQLLRTGVLQRRQYPRPEQLPSWAKTAVVAPDENAEIARATELFDLLEEQFAANSLDARWSHWQSIARIWAELTNLHYHQPTHLDSSQRADYKRWQDRLDAAFPKWLQSHYAPLANKRLPQPHHLYHMLDYIAYQRKGNQRVALLVMDGMSLADWLLIQERWQTWQPNRDFDEHLLLAQIPSITAISRQALASGLRPAEFAETLSHNREESKHWSAFWTRQGLAQSACAYDRLKLGEGDSRPSMVSSSRIHSVCLINSDIDNMLHGASLGASDVQASLRVWLDQRLPRLIALVSDLLKRDFSVYITSDHGHTETTGMGQPAEGLAVETRSKRARIYRDERMALEVQSEYPDTILWRAQGLLPEDTWTLLAGNRKAFAYQGAQVVTHGSITLDELVVPLIRVKTRP